LTVGNSIATTRSSFILSVLPQQQAELMCKAAEDAVGRGLSAAAKDTNRGESEQCTTTTTTSGMMLVFTTVEATHDDNVLRRANKK